ncbi:MAG: DUF2752 domain-containing protein [Lachnospiraceae bacterium]|nr:DUF2752 domain-containing protein [Lachnospiraceae bacterium]
MKNIRQKKLENQLYIVGICMPVVILAAVFVYKRFADFFAHFYIPCLFYNITGLYCPGCGGTRAVLSLVQGEILLSFFYHPLVLYTIIVYLWFMISHTIEKISRGRWLIGMQYRDGYLWIALLILIVNIAVKDIALTAFHTDILKLLDRWYFMV